MSVGGKYLSEGRNWLAWQQEHRDEPIKPVPPDEPAKPARFPLADRLTPNDQEALKLFRAMLPKA